MFGLSVRPSVTKLAKKMSEVISMQISVSGPRGKGMKRSGQRSRSHVAEVSHKYHFQLDF